MVGLEAVRKSNALIATQLPAKLVAVFVGATAGIGEGTIKQFARLANAPCIYFVGRSETKGNRITDELKTINPSGEYVYIAADISLIRNVDDVCRQIKDREAFINLLFMSCGSLVFHTGMVPTPAHIIR
jgi:short-subunit dehydrogenase